MLELSGLTKSYSTDAGGNPDKVQWVTVGSGSVRIQGLIAGTYQATAFNTIYTTQAPLRHKLLEKSPSVDDFMINDFALAAQEKLGAG